MADDDDISSSSDSDDEFLTTSHTSGGGTTDREALVRKKLLENFYGKTVVATDNDASSSYPPTVTTIAAARSSRNSSKQRHDDEVDIDDLDSIAFDSVKHAEHHIRSSTTHALLETEEKLALQVRTLDSTMQTLVYENYSRFIDATDAIRSIGVNVTANESGLRQLTESMGSVNDQSRIVEDALGSLRDQVAEKIRVQRLLTRLDALLKLPATLQEQIAAGKYRTATRSYLQAASILAKHSEGFESLKSIETECNAILEQLKADLERKMLHWSGKLTGMDNTYSDDDDVADSSYHSSGMEGNENIPDPPRNMTEVFECAGTLFILLQEEQSKGGGSAISDAMKSSEDLYVKAVAAAMRLLDRLLDSHLIQVQERRFVGMDLGHENSNSMMTMMEPSPSKMDGSSLIPRSVLVAILEGATLFGISFEASNKAGTDGIKGFETSSNRGDYLMDFVTEAFSSFLSHVRSILLEESIQASRDDNSAEDCTEANHKEISGALLLLVQYVQELASGLVAPDVGINTDYAAKLVDQTMELAESMVRRRVDQKFHDLRLAVVKDCLVPFATRAVKERENAIKDDKPVLPQIVHIASSALSDCLQLVDDAIRSIFAESSSAAGDLPDLKEAVQTSTYRFASWLANAFEIIAGGDSTDSKHIAEAPLLDIENTLDSAGMDAEGMEGFDGTANNNVMVEDFGDFSDQELVDMMHAAREHLLSGCDDGVLHPDFILAIVELCRLSEVSVPENLEQSFTSHLGVGKKKSRGIFPTGQSLTTKTAQGEDNEICKRFKLAGSRVLVLYATNSGAEAANILCKDLADLAMKSDDVPTNPSTSTLAVVSVAKKTAIECANIFGGSKRGGPVPTWEDNIMPGLSMTMLNRKTGLQLDVERMFKEIVTIYPHPSELMEASRNAVLFLFFKIVFRALFENARLHTFSSGGYRQIQVDTAFLKHIVPHYLSNEYTENGTNGCAALLTLLDDVLEVVDDRCADESCTQNHDLKQEAREVVRSFMATVEDSTLADQFIIKED
jgi:vacuolar protein sorting-associated protein 51